MPPGRKRSATKNSCDLFRTLRQCHHALILFHDTPNKISLHKIAKCITLLSYWDKGLKSIKLKFKNVVFVNQQYKFK